MPRKKRSAKQPSRSAKRQSRNREATIRASSAAAAAVAAAASGAPEVPTTTPTGLPEYDVVSPLELGDGGDTVADLSEGISAIAEDPAQANKVCVGIIKLRRATAVIDPTDVKHDTSLTELTGAELLWIAKSMQPGFLCKQAGVRYCA